MKSYMMTHGGMEICFPMGNLREMKIRLSGSICRVVQSQRSIKMNIDILMASANIAAEDEMPEVLQAIKNYQFPNSDNEPC